jgi:truncated hemoglobin YjbI
MRYEITGGKSATLYEKMGGDGVVDMAINLMFDKALKDKRAKEYFSNADMAALRINMKDFIVMASGGPNR